MELLQLYYFRVAAKHEHMTRAAEELKIAQPSLSKTIARLEEHIGVPLFDRQGRQIKLNAFGRAYLERVERVFAELAEGKREVRDMAGLSNGSIMIAASVSNVLPELLSAFLELHPNVHFRQVLEPTAVMKRMLEDGEIDLCITTASIEGNDLEWRALRTEEICVRVPERHRLAGQGEVALADLKDESFIGLRPGYWFRDLTDRLCAEAGFTPNTMIEVDESEAILRLVARGLGISFAPNMSWVIRPHPVTARLRITDPNCQVTIGLGWSSKHYLSAAAREFRAFVIEYFERLQP